MDTICGPQFPLYAATAISDYLICVFEVQSSELLDFCVAANLTSFPQGMSISPISLVRVILYAP
jgi:hypothetical protein